MKYVLKILRDEKRVQNWRIKERKRLATIYDGVAVKKFNQENVNNVKELESAIKLILNHKDKE